mmetsp:Transcript_29997/g.29233  ORF Transcript_29997/g.29233 Transcript_29997/m.29233 type:complete len:90 (+) Transcript_29997:100-369(+)
MEMNYVEFKSTRRTQHVTGFTLKTVDMKEPYLDVKGQYIHLACMMWVIYKEDNSRANHGLKIGNASPNSKECNLEQKQDTESDIMQIVT